LEKLEKAFKQQSNKGKKCHQRDSDSNTKSGIGSDSTGRIAINLEETIKKTKFTSPTSPIKATPTLIANNHCDVCPMSFSNAGDVMMMSSSQNKGIKVNYSTTTNKDPPEGKTTAVIAVMRSKPKNGYHHHCSNKHYRQKLVRAL
jgi:hypothetical protein